MTDAPKPTGKPNIVTRCKWCIGGIIGYFAGAVRGKEPVGLHMRLLAKQTQFAFTEHKFMTVGFAVLLLLTAVDSADRLAIHGFKLLVISLLAVIGSCIYFVSKLRPLLGDMSASRHVLTPMEEHREALRYPRQFVAYSFIFLLFMIAILLVSVIFSTGPEDSINVEEVDSNSPLAQYYYAKQYEEAGNDKAALEALEEYFEEPGNYYAPPYLYMLIEESDEKFYQKMIELAGKHPDKPVFEYFAATKRPYNEAREIFRKQIKQFPDFPLAYYGLSGDSFDDAGDETKLPLSERKEQAEAYKKFAEFYKAGKLTAILEGSMDTGIIYAVETNLKHVQDTAPGQHSFEFFAPEFLDNTRKKIPFSEYGSSFAARYSAAFINIIFKVNDEATAAEFTIDGEHFEKGGKFGYNLPGGPHAEFAFIGTRSDMKKYDLEKIRAFGRVEVTYTNASGEKIGPFSEKFDLIAQIRKQARGLLDEGKCQGINAYGPYIICREAAPALKNIHYGVNTDTPNKSINVGVSDEEVLKYNYLPNSLNDPYNIEVFKKATLFSVQYEYHDGTMSDVITLGSGPRRN